MDKTQIRQEIKDIIASYASDYGLNDSDCEGMAKYCSSDIMELFVKLEKEVID